MITPQQTQRRRKAFTLIELLVVIAIITILAAMLFPVFARARASARRAGCISNLKQMGLGMMMYVQDNDGMYPRSQYVQKNVTPANGWWKSVSSGYWYWPNMIYPYVKSNQVFICPSSANAGTKYNYPEGPRNRHYGANRSILRSVAAYPNMAMAAVQAPSKTYLLMDSSTIIIRYDDITHPITNANYFLPGACGIIAGSTVTSIDCVKSRHFDGVSVAFADGHVKWLKTQTMIAEAKKSNHGAWLPTNS